MINEESDTYVCCGCGSPLTKEEIEYNRLNKLSGYCLFCQSKRLLKKKDKEDKEEKEEKEVLI